MPNNTLIADRPRRSRNFALVAAAGALLMWSGVASAALAPDSFANLAKKVTPAVVNIVSSHEIQDGQGPQQELPFDVPEGSPFEKFFKQFQDRNGQGDGRKSAPQMAVGVGSGFIIDAAGFVVTNNHVVNGAKEVKVRLDDDSIYVAKLIGTDAATDLALLKIDAGRSLPAVEFGDSDAAQVGDWVMAVGNPFGLGGTVTSGIISARSRNISSGPYDDFLQIDASINKGNSGGPLFDLAGKVIGINTAIFSPTGGSVGIGFSIPSNIAKTVIAQLKETGRVERGWLGVQIQNVTPEIAEALGLKTAKGVIVNETQPGSPADAAGINQGDVILSFDGKTVDSARDLALKVAAKSVGKKAELTVWRNQAEKTLQFVAGDKPGQVAAATTESGVFHSDALNADLAALDAERRAKFDIGADVNGVLVLDVTGASAEQGLLPGDVIKQVAQTPVTTPQTVESNVQKARTNGSGSVLLLVNRQGQDQFLGLKLRIS